MLRKVGLLVSLLFISFLSTLAQGPPCWDKVPPSTKYASRHVVGGDTGLFAPWDTEPTHLLSVDGLNVDAKLTDGDTYLKIEITVTNCSPKTVEIRPMDFRLTVVSAKGDTNLGSLDPTSVVQFPKTSKTFPALVPQTLIYGRIGTFAAFFARDGKAKSFDRLHSNYSLVLAVPIENWQFDFTFARKSL